MSVASLLRNVRLRNGLSQRGLAQKAGVPQSTVARIELGTLSPRTDTIQRLLLAVGQELSVESKLGVGVDRSQIQELLRLTPRQRLELAARDAAGLARLERRIRHG